MTVKGWCPGAYRPMMSGDGLIVRIRPRMGRLSADQALGLCDASRRFGNGVIDLTSRANLQLRGVSEASHQALLNALLHLDLLDATPELEARRNIITTPLWTRRDLTHRLHDAICARLADLPALPAKMGLAIDTGAAPILQNASGDFRFERSADGALILRLDGMSRGRSITEDTAVAALIEAADWFARTRKDQRRMAGHVNTTPPPADWIATLPAAATARLTPGRTGNDMTYGAPFGALDAAALGALINDSTATGLRTTPWRLFILEHAEDTDAHGFVITPNDPLLTTHACPGAPACAQATTDTRALARKLADTHRDLHVSGCAKGCAHPHPATTTLVGQNGRYDLVKQGHPWDQPSQRGLAASDLEAMTDAL